MTSEIMERKKAVEGEALKEKAEAAAKKAAESAEDERLELEAYRDLDNSSPEDAHNKEYVGYLRARYEQVKGDYTTLMCNQREAEGAKNDEMKNRLSTLFTTNYRTRKWLVRELRSLGEKIEDKFIK
jgi:hypothetical protein